MYSFGYCEKNAREKDSRCRKYAVQATRARKGDLVRVTRACGSARPFERKHIHCQYIHATPRVRHSVAIYGQRLLFCDQSMRSKAWLAARVSLRLASRLRLRQAFPRMHILWPPLIKDKNQGQGSHAPSCHSALQVCNAGFKFPDTQFSKISRIKLGCG